MRRFVFVVLVGMFVVAAGRAQSDVPYGSERTVNVFVNYSNDSSHMFIGQEENRKIAGVGVGYAWRLAHKRLYDFTYEVDLLPVTFIRDPVVSGTSTVVISGMPGTVGGLPISGPFNGPTLSECMSGTRVTTGTVPGGVTYTQTVVQQCGDRWTYAAGASPVGLRVEFEKRHRLQPFLVGNGGFLLSTRDLPVNQSARFNFTFEFGAGLEWFSDHRHSVTIDYRLHHLSNAYHGTYNPGIDSGVFRVGYRFGR